MLNTVTFQDDADLEPINWKPLNVDFYLVLGIGQYRYTQYKYPDYPIRNYPIRKRETDWKTIKILFPVTDYENMV